MDIIERIEAYDASFGAHSDAAGGSAYDLLEEAVEEIKFLRAELETANAAHRDIAQRLAEMGKENEKLRKVITEFLAAHDEIMAKASEDKKAGRPWSPSPTYLAINAIVHMREAIGQPTPCCQCGITTSGRCPVCLTVAL